MMQTSNKRGDNIVKKIMRKTSTLRRHHHKATDSTVTIHFKLRKFAEDYPGEVILISGSIPELGSGSLENAPRMYVQETSEGRVWKYDLVVPVKELEHSRMDIAGSYDGNPHGLFFTFNYVVKNTGNPVIEKFEAIPRRGLPKASLATTNSLGEETNLKELSLDHEWGNMSASRLSSSVVPRNMSESLKTEELIKPSKAEVPISDPARLMGKASAPSSSPTMQPRSQVRTTDQIPRLVAVPDVRIADRSVSFIDRKEDRAVLDIMDEPVPSSTIASENSSTIFPESASVISTTTISPAPVMPTMPSTTVLSTTSIDRSAKKKAGLFGWYRSLRGDSSSRSLSVMGIENMKISEVPQNDRNLSDFGFTNIESSFPTTFTKSLPHEDKPELPPSPVLSPRSRSRSDVSDVRQSEVRVRDAESPTFEEHRRAEDERIMKAQFSLRRSYDSYRSTTDLMMPSTTASTTPTDASTIPEMDMEPLPEIPRERHEDLIHDPLTRAISSEKSENFSGIEELENYAIAALKKSVLRTNYGNSPVVVRTPEVPRELDSTAGLVPPMGDWNEKSEEISEEISEDVLLDRIEENTPLLSNENSQFQEISEEEVVESPKSLARSDVVDFADFRSEPISASISELISETIRSVDQIRSVDPVLSGKMHKVGQELKQKVGGEVTWGSYLRDLQSKRSLQSVDPILSGKWHKIGQEIKRKVNSDATCTDYLKTRKSANVREAVDPVLSGKWHRVGSELKNKIGEYGSWMSFLGGLKSDIAALKSEKADYRSEMSEIKSEKSEIVNYNGVNPITSGKLALVNRELKAKVPAVVAIPEMKIFVNSPIPEKLEIDEIKTKSVFDEQAEKELIHRRHHVTVPEPILQSETPETPRIVKDFERVGYHATRDDFMPIMHSESMIAEVPAPKSPASSYAAFAVFFTIVLWLFLYSIYFPESILMEMSPSASVLESEAVIAVPAQINLAEHHEI